MLPALPLFHRIAGQAVIVVGEGEAAAAKARLVERAGGRVVTDISEGLAAGARLGFVACEDDAEAEAAAAKLRAVGILVNCADRPALCDFTVPSLLERSPVLIAVGTGGASAGLAKALRLRLEALLPPGLGTLAQALYEARTPLRARFPDPATRRRALDIALSERGALDPLAAGGGERVAAWLAARLTGAAPTAPTEIHLRSADPDDLTLREARLLGTADGIAHEPGVPQAVLVRARADAARLCLARGETFGAGTLTKQWVVVRQPA